MRHQTLAGLLIVSMLSISTVACSDNNADNNNPPIDRTDPDTTPDSTDVPDDSMDMADVVPDVIVVPDETDDSTDVPDVTDETDDTADADMGPDPRDLDDDYDGLSNYDESLGCTDPNNWDTDGDTLNDAVEYQMNSDPCNADSDADGLDDYLESYFGFDPNSADSEGDGVSDGDRFIVRACDTPQSEPVLFEKSNKGDWLIGLPTAFSNYSELAIQGSDPRESAAVYDDPNNEVSGFILSVEKTGLNSVQTLQGYKPKINQVGNIYQDLTEGQFSTHDSNQAAPGEYRITAPGKTVRQVRDDLLFKLSGRPAGDISGLPVSSGNARTNYYIKVTVIERADRLITLVATAPEQFYNDRDQVQFRLSDLTNTTNISQAGDEEELRCHAFPTDLEIPKADFYWILDNSGSMDNINTRMSGFAVDFYNQLQNTTLNFRLGVTNTESSSMGRFRAAGWHTDPNTFSTEILQYVVNLNGFAEYGLRNAKDGITYMSQSSTPLAQRIRPDATLATIIISDEESETLQSASGTTKQNRIDAFSNFFKNKTLMFAIVTLDQQCRDSLGGGSIGEGYAAVALATGGAVASLCSTDLLSTISQILDKVTGAASTFTLPQTPISSTIRVFRGSKMDATRGEWAPRSRVGGFDYFPQRNALAFFGDFRPQPNEKVQVAVHYRTFRDVTKNPPVVVP